MSATTNSNSTSTPVDPTPFFALVGVTDLAAARVRAAVANAAAAQAQVEKAVGGFDPRAAASTAPSRAVAAALTVAGLGQARYEELATHGRDVVERVLARQSTADLITQGRNTLSRTRGAVTTVRRAGDDVATAVRSVTRAARRETDAVVEETSERSSTSARTTARAARTAATKATKATKDGPAATSATRAARASAKRTAAARKAAEGVGEEGTL